MEFQPLAAMSLELGDMLFYLILFILLMLLVGKFAWGPVSNMMEKRREQVTYDLDHAQKSREEAEELAIKRETALKNSKAEAQEILQTAKSNGDAQKQKIIDEASNEAVQIKEKAQEAAKQQKADALQEAKGEVANLSVLIAEKLIDKKLSVADQENLIDSFIKELDQ